MPNVSIAVLRSAATDTNAVADADASAAFPDVSIAVLRRADADLKNDADGACQMFQLLF